MTKDEKNNLPAMQSGAVPAQRREEYLTSPVRGRSLIGRAVSRFIAQFNTWTVTANTGQVRALEAYAKARGDLADASLDAERRIYHYVEHRDDILRDDHDKHLDQMEENRHQRELNRRRRQETLHALDDAAARSAIKRTFDPDIERAKKEAELAQANWEADRARWGRDAFNQSMPHRKERIEQIYKSGALDKELERVILEAEIASERDKLPPVGRSDPSATATSNTLKEQLLREIDEEIELAHRTQASDDVKATLYAMRARLQSKLAAHGADRE